MRFQKEWLDINCHHLGKYKAFIKMQISLYKYINKWKEENSKI